MQIETTDRRKEVAMINEKYKAMLGGKSIIRELSEYATARGNEIGYENYSTHIDPIIINDKVYLSWSAWNSKIAKSAVIWINYDFDNDKVNDYVVVEK